MLQNMQFVELIKQIMQFLLCHIKKKVTQNIVNARTKDMLSYYGGLTPLFLP